MWVVVVPNVAFVGLLTVTCTVSLLSFKASSTTVMEMVSVVTPALKERVPEARV